MSLGTVFHRTPGLIEAIVAALRDEAVELDVAVGFDQDPARLGQQPPNVHVDAWLPIAERLHRCDLFVTHGGFNSVKEALTAAVPMVVIPVAGDQPYAANRCETLGVAEVIQPHDRTVERIRAAALRVLHNPSYKNRAKVVRAELAALPPIEAATTALRDLPPTQSRQDGAQRQLCGYRSVPSLGTKRPVRRA